MTLGQKTRWAYLFYNAPKPIQGSSFTENKEKMFIQTSATRQELSAIPMGLLTQQFIDSHTKNEAWGIHLGCHTDVLVSRQPVINKPAFHKLLLSINQCMSTT